jgi:putative ATPase
MLEAGEDPRFIARRLVILASEDIGLADSNGLVVADAAARAVEFVGMPEARHNLAHAVIYLALAPKSNTAARAIWAATESVQHRRSGPVPIHLRDAHYRGAKTLGHGEGYEYPHADPRGWVPQEHLPPEVAGEQFYTPGPHGAEPELQAARERRMGGDDGSD